MRPMTEGERQEFRAGPHVAVLSVARDGGRAPHATPVRHAYEPGGDVTFFTGTQGRRRSRKAELIGRAGRSARSAGGSGRRHRPAGAAQRKGTVTANLKGKHR